MEIFTKNTVQFRYTLYDEPWQMIVFESDDFYAVRRYVLTILDDFETAGLSDMVLFDRERDKRYKGEEIEKFFNNDHGGLV